MEITQRDWTPTGIAYNFPILLHPSPNFQTIWSVLPEQPNHIVFSNKYGGWGTMGVKWSKALPHWLRIAEDCLVGPAVPL